MDWGACLSIIIGIYLVGKKERCGFLLIATGAAVSISLQIKTEPPLWGLATQSAIVVLMNGWAYWKWKQEKKGTQ